MHRSSESVAGLATALAKAQIELVNPEKSLIANIRSERAGVPAQSFRYAPLSSGLDIIRKTLGRHEIAVMQTTAVDAASGIINLTTMLAHTTGEWIAIVGRAQWRNPEDVKASYPKASILKGNGEIFYTLREAQIVIESWRRHYSTVRPHASLGYRRPAPGGVRAGLCRVAGCAKSNNSAGHAGATTDPELTFRLDQSMQTGQRDRCRSCDR